MWISAGACRAGTARCSWWRPFLPGASSSSAAPQTSTVRPEPTKVMSLGHGESGEPWIFLNLVSYLQGGGPLVISWFIKNPLTKIYLP